MRCGGWSASSAASRPTACRPVAPRSSRRQDAERRVTLRKEGTTAYWKAVYHAPGVRRRRLLPPARRRRRVERRGRPEHLVGRARGPRRSAARGCIAGVVDTGLASSVHGALLPTAQPFLYSVSARCPTGSTLAAVEDAVLEEIDRLVARRHHRSGAGKGQGPAPRPLRLRHGRRDRHRPPAWLLRDHRLVARRVSARRAPGGGDARREVHDVAREVFAPSNRTIGWFEPRRAPCR